MKPEVIAGLDTAGDGMAGRIEPWVADEPVLGDTLTSRDTADIAGGVSQPGATALVSQREGTDQAGMSARWIETRRAIGRVGVVVRIEVADRGEGVDHVIGAIVAELGADRRRLGGIG